MSAHHQILLPQRTPVHRNMVIIASPGTRRPDTHSELTPPSRTDNEAGRAAAGSEIAATTCPAQSPEQLVVAIDTGPDYVPRIRGSSASRSPSPM